jgi:hypothetical protein
MPKSRRNSGNLWRHRCEWIAELGSGASPSGRSCFSVLGQPVASLAIDCTKPTTAGSGRCSMQRGRQNASLRRMDVLRSNITMPNSPSAAVARRMASAARRNTAAGRFYWQRSPGCERFTDLRTSARELHGRFGYRLAATCSAIFADIITTVTAPYRSVPVVQPDPLAFSSCATLA